MTRLDFAGGSRLTEFRETFLSGYLVPIGKWHQIVNPSEQQTNIIEIQYGDECTEEDIERII